MDFTIGKKKYSLTKVSIYISDLYGEYARLRNEAASFELETSAIQNDNEIERKEADLMVLDAKESMEDPESRVGKIKVTRAILESEIAKKRADKKMYAKMGEYKGVILENASLAGEKRNEVLQAIVELNGYDWDSGKWLGAVSESDFSDLTEELFTGKKKEAENSST